MMEKQAGFVQSVLLVGPSTRAMAYSARRAGFEPICVDLFGDTDLQKIASVEIIPIDEYPEGLIERLKKHPQNIPVLFTGGLENHPQVYLQLQKQRPVWGYVHPDPMHGESVRNPEYLDHLADFKGFCRPRHQRSCRQTSRWLVKPRAGAGGKWIRFWNGEQVPGTHFIEEFLGGISLSAAFIQYGSHVSCLGITEQLVGCDFVHAPTPFSYVGSISKAETCQESTVLRSSQQTSRKIAGPDSKGQMSTSSPCHDITLLEEIKRIGQALTKADPYLLGLFGVDFILCDDALYLIEVNPRYTASLELLEYATGQAFLGLQCKAFGQPSRSENRKLKYPTLAKAIYFATHQLTFPDEGPWSGQDYNDLWNIPDYADIPVAGSVLEKGQPVLTLFVKESENDKARTQLEKRANALDWIFQQGS